MPIVNVKFSSPMPTKDEQDKIAKEFTKILVKNLGKNPDRTLVVFEEIPAESFYFAGLSTADYRKNLEKDKKSKKDDKNSKKGKKWASLVVKIEREK